MINVVSKNCDKIPTLNKKEYNNRIKTLFETIDKFISYQDNIVFKEIMINKFK